MAITLSERALITVQDVEDAALSGIETDVSGLDSSKAISRIINAVTDIISEHLHRNLHVHAETFYPAAADWRTSRNPNYSFELWATFWPIVEVTSETTVELGTASAGGQLVYSDTKHDEITAFVGYRRHGDDLEALVLLGGLGALTVLPDVLPDVVTDRAATIALHFIEERLAGRFSGNRKVQGIGTGSVSVEASDRKMIQRLLHPLLTYVNRAA